MKASRTFPAQPQSVPAARRFATEILSGLPADDLQAIELMVSELATNGIRHGQTSFELTIEQNGDQLRIEVRDSGAGTPAMRFPGPDEPTGRGLQIVEMLSAAWGVEPAAGSGKTVWFTLGIPGAEDEPGRSTSTGGRFRRPAEPTAWLFVVGAAAPVHS